MKLKHFNHFKIGDKIEVAWLDTNTQVKYGWDSAEDFEKENAKVMIKSISYFYGIVNKQLNIAADKFVNKKYISNINRKMTIPLGCIIKARKI